MCECVRVCLCVWQRTWRWTMKAAAARCRWRGVAAACRRTCIVRTRLLGLVFYPQLGAVPYTHDPEGEGVAEVMWRWSWRLSSSPLANISQEDLPRLQLHEPLLLIVTRLTSDLWLNLFRLLMGGWVDVEGTRNEKCVVFVSWHWIGVREFPVAVTMMLRHVTWRFLTFSHCFFSFLSLFFFFFLHVGVPEMWKAECELLKWLAENYWT